MLTETVRRRCSYGTCLPADSAEGHKRTGATVVYLTTRWSWLASELNPHLLVCVFTSLPPYIPSWLLIVQRRESTPPRKQTSQPLVNMIPSFDVSHLPSSASFFSTILQPLGIVYLSSDHPSVPASSEQSLVLTYGTLSSGSAVLQLRQTSRPKRSHAVLSAPSPTSVSECHGLACRANPGNSNATLAGPRIAFGAVGGESQCRITDLDGNIVDIIYKASPTQETPSAAEQNGHVLGWDSLDTPDKHLTVTAIGDREPVTILRRSVTTSVIEQPSKDTSPEHSSNATTIIGALLGAAAGAALTYGVMKGEARRASQPQVAPPPVSRRATFPVEGIHDFAAAADTAASAPYYGGGRYMEVKKSVEQLHYPQEYASVIDHWRPQHQQYLATYSQAGAPQSRAMGDDNELRSSQRSAQSVAQGPAGSETHSDVSQVPRPPLMLMDHEHRSIAGSVPGSARLQPVLARSCEPTDRDSFVSARSQRSASTIKGPPPPTVETELATRSRASSRAPSTKQRSIVSSRHSNVGTEIQKQRSVVSSRHLNVGTEIQKQRSVVSSRHSNVSTEIQKQRSVVGSLHSNTGLDTQKQRSVVGSRHSNTGLDTQKQRSVVGSRHSNAGLERGATEDQFHSKSVASSITVTKDGGGRDADVVTAEALHKASRASSRVSARHIGLPMSGVGSSHAGWDDDHVSVAPSDSISCVGSRGARRHEP
ncbi:hypothetical protein B0T11DRAFT_12507 [Plectosphaerella cucumerina]|uniref:Uncharacterized protein n=1 Tax=Plectosphaerella cucumerina TaxID=40658 RepID=A0A8K0TPM1_9PEZI|nr:hypothetical protein B0T11DRAFT_12507 [Plectosphaerella cucumerina]